MGIYMLQLDCFIDYSVAQLLYISDNFKAAEIYYSYKHLTFRLLLQI